MYFARKTYAQKKWIMRVQTKELFLMLNWFIKKPRPLEAVSGLFSNECANVTSR